MDWQISKAMFNDLSVSKNMAEAADILVSIRQNVDKVPAGMDPVDYFFQQGNLYERPAEETLDILRIYEKYKTSPKKIATIFDAYMDMVEAAGAPREPEMFAGTPDVPSKVVALRAAVREMEAKYGIEETAGLPGAGATPEPRGGGTGRKTPGALLGPEATKGPGEEGSTLEEPRGQFGLPRAEEPPGRQLGLPFDFFAIPEVKERFDAGSANPEEVAANTEEILGDLEGRGVSAPGDLPHRISEKSPIGRALLKHGKVTLNTLQLKAGQEAHDLAELFQVFRSPKAETSHVVYTDADGYIVGATAYSSGAIDYVSMPEFPRFLSGIQSQMERLGAVKAHMLHNHPSGNTDLSRQDLNMVRSLSRKLGEKMGEFVVIDHGKFGYIRNYLSAGQVAAQGNYTPLADMPDWISDKPLISSVAALAEFASGLKYDRDNALVAVHLSTDKRMMGWEPLSLNILDKPFATARDIFQQRMKAHNAAEVALVVNEAGLEKAVNFLSNHGMELLRNKALKADDYFYNWLTDVIVGRGSLRHEFDALWREPKTRQYGAAVRLWEKQKQLDLLEPGAKEEKETAGVGAFMGKFGSRAGKPEGLLTGTKTEDERDEREAKEFDEKYREPGRFPLLDTDPQVGDTTVYGKLTDAWRDKDGELHLATDVANFNRGQVRRVLDDVKKASPLLTAPDASAWWDGLSPKEKQAAFYEEYGFKKMPKEYRGAFADLGKNEQEEIQALQGMRQQAQAEAPEFGLTGTAKPGSRLEQRLTDLQAQFPDMDREKASMVIRSFPDADDNQIANMVADPVMFSRVLKSAMTTLERQKASKGMEGQQPDLFGGAISGFTLREEGTTWDDPETRQQWTDLEDDPSYNRFKALIDRNNFEIYDRLKQPGNTEIRLYQGERFTPRAGNQIVEKPGAKPRMLSKEEIYERMYDPKRPLAQPEGTQAVGRASLLQGLEGSVTPPPASKAGRLDLLARSVKEKLSVQSISKIAAWAHQSLVEHMGWSAREMIKAATVLGKYNKLFDEMAPEELYAFEENRLDEMVKDGKMTQERRDSLNEASQAWRRLSDGFHWLVADAKGGEFAYWKDYFPRLFQNPELAQDVIGDYLKARGRRGGGGAGFLKERTQLTLAQSIRPKLESRRGADGRIEVSQRDIYDGTQTPMQTFDTEAEARDFIEKEGGLGLKMIDPNYATVMKGNIWEKARWLQDNYIKEDLEEAGFIKKGRQAGWVPVPDRGVWRGYYAHPDVAAVIEKHLSPGIRNDPLFKAYYEPFSFMNEVFVGFSAFHASFSTLSFLSQGVGMNLPRAIGAAFRGDTEAMGYHLKQLGKTLNVVQSYKEASKYISQYGAPGTYPELEFMVDLLQKGGVRVKADAFAKMNQGFVDALRESKVSMPRSVVRLFASPIMNGIVPHFKMIADVRRLDNELFYARRQAQAEGRVLGKEELINLAQKVTREGDNIFGQMVYDNLGMNRAWKDMLSLYIGFPGWNLGSFKMIGDAVRGISHLTGETARYGVETLTGRKASWRSMPIEQRMGMEFFGGMTLVMALGGVIIQRLLSGKWPESGKDLFMPQTGATLPNGEPERVRMPTYLRDVLSLNHPLDMIAHKQAFPLRLAQSFIANQDYFGEQIRDPWASVPEQIKQTLEYSGRSVLPFGIQGVMKTEDPRAKALNLIGITKVPRVYTNSPAANIIDEYNQLMRASTTTKETAESKKLRGSLLKLAREQDEIGFQEAASQAVSEGKLTRQQIKGIVDESEAPPGMGRFTRLPMEWKLRTWEAASDYEKEQWRPYLLKAIFQEKPETIIKLRGPLETALRADGMDDAADEVANINMPEQPLGALDMTGLGLPKPAPEMQGLDAIDSALAESIQDKVAATIKKQRGTSTRLPGEKRRNFGLLGFNQ